jgi:hypothetical protein
LKSLPSARLCTIETKSSLTSKHAHTSTGELARAYVLPNSESRHLEKSTAPLWRETQASDHPPYISVVFLSEMQTHSPLNMLP